MASESSIKPNIILILSDDQGSWALGSYGNRELKTPNLDALAGEGTRFENFFCTSPVCSPARASILTGRIPSCHGVHDWLSAGNTVSRKLEPAGNGKLIEYLQGIPGYTDILKGAGWFCGISGKWHLGDSHNPQKGFEFWKVHAKGGGPYYGAPVIEDGVLREEPRYITDAITDNALEFLEAAKKKQGPFCLNVCYTAPHSPWEKEHHPAKLFNMYYNDCPFESAPENVKKPGWVERVNMPVEDGEKRRTFLSGYYASITAMDRNIGRILKWLDDNKLRENTLVVFMSDNGMNMGHHGVYGKGNATFPLNMFEESVKVPCIISMPGKIEEGSSDRRLLNQYDFMPSVLELSGLETPAGKRLPGRSFFRESGDARDFIVVFSEYGPVRMARTADWKYIRRYPSHGAHELYDLKNDPGENDNLAGMPGYKNREKELGGLITEWFLKHSHPARDGFSKEVDGSGQSGPFSPDPAPAINGDVDCLK